MSSGEQVLLHACECIRTDNLEDDTIYCRRCNYVYLCCYTPEAGVKNMQHIIFFHLSPVWTKLRIRRMCTLDPKAIAQVGLDEVLNEHCNSCSVTCFSLSVVRGVRMVRVRCALIHRMEKWGMGVVHVRRLNQIYLCLA